MSWKETWLDWICGENMEVSKFESDILIGMTEEMHRSFIAAGCNPTCHCCNDEIPVGAYYKLGSVNYDHIDRCKKKHSFYS